MLHSLYRKALRNRYVENCLQSEIPAKSASLSIPGWGMVRVINSVQVCVFVLNHGPRQDVLKLSNMGGGGGKRGGRGRNNIVRSDKKLYELEAFLSEYAFFLQLDPENRCDTCGYSPNA